MLSSKRKATAAPLDEEEVPKKRQLPPLRKEAPSPVQDVPVSLPTIPSLPPSVWGHVLDYMPYQDVRSALLVSKTIATEATSYVQTLNIMKGSQLDIPAARRFSGSLQSINILCLLRQTEDNYHDTISEDAARRILPFISIFPVLKKAFVGGALERPTGAVAMPGQKITFIEDMCRGPKNHREIFRALITSFLGAFETRSLPNTLKSLEGILNSGRTSGSCIKDQKPCYFCSQICRYFPFEALMEGVTAALQKNWRKLAWSWTLPSKVSDFLAGMVSN